MFCVVNNTKCFIFLGVEKGSELLSWVLLYAMSESLILLPKPTKILKEETKLQVVLTRSVSRDTLFLGKSVLASIFFIFSINIMKTITKRGFYCYNHVHSWYLPAGKMQFEKQRG